MALITGTSLWKFDRMYDMHRWVGEDECLVCIYSKPGTTHPMRCADCGIRRYANAEQSCSHYWTHDQPDGTVHEVIPPCGTKQPDPAMAMLDTVRICDYCGHLLQEDKVADRCHYDCKVRGTSMFAGTKELRLVRKL